MATFSTLNRAKDAILSAGLTKEDVAIFFRSTERHGAHETFVLNSDLNSFITAATAVKGLLPETFNLAA